MEVFWDRRKPGARAAGAPAGAPRRGVRAPSAGLPTGERGVAAGGKPPSPRPVRPLPCRGLLKRQPNINRYMSPVGCGGQRHRQRRLLLVDRRPLPPPPADPPWGHEALKGLRGTACEGPQGISAGSPRRRQRPRPAPRLCGPNQFPAEPGRGIEVGRGTVGAGEGGGQSGPHRWARGASPGPGCLCVCCERRCRVCARLACGRGRSGAAVLCRIGWGASWEPGAGKNRKERPTLPGG
jgi:hypothetical protein